MHVDDPEDLELRSIDPSKNRYRVYGITECRTLFGELCLRIVWGRLGARRMRERSEVFPDRTALRQRRDELLAQRRRHGYVSTTTRRAEARARAGARNGGSPSPSAAMARAIVEAHGLDPQDKVARSLVARWREATLALIDHARAKGADGLDLVDASTLASLFTEAA